MGDVSEEISNRSEEAALRAAEERGRRAALAFAEALRAEEAEERRRLLARSRAARGEVAPNAVFAVGAGPEAVRLHEELQRLRQFRRSVLRSKGWRLVQFLRRLVGRAW